VAKDLINKQRLSV